MSYELKGKLVEKYNTQQVSDKFKKREFVLEIEEIINGNIYTNYAKMQLMQNKCDILDPFSVGQNLKVQFNVKGNKWIRDDKPIYMTNLDVWKIEADGAQQSAPAPAPKQQYQAPQNYQAPTQGSFNDGNVAPIDDQLPF